MIAPSDFIQGLNLQGALTGLEGTVGAVRCWDRDGLTGAPVHSAETLALMIGKQFWFLSEMLCG